VIPTIVVLRIDGHGVEHLSLHTKRGQALDRLVEVGAKVWRDRFDYTPEAYGRNDPHALSDALRAEGWRVRVEEREVEL
jgi:hypothetical protein